jgi:hypothetical protein
VALLDFEQERNPFTTPANQSYYNASCFTTDARGVGRLDWWWDARGWKWAHGSRAWYLEAAEREAGAKYRRFGTRFVVDYEWPSRDPELACVEAALGVAIPAARTEAWYVHLHTPFNADAAGTGPLAPNVAVATARFDPVAPLGPASVLPEKASWFGRTAPRVVEPDAYATLRVRIFRVRPRPALRLSPHRATLPLTAPQRLLPGLLAFRAGARGR